MVDKNGLVCEYDGYAIPEKGEDTPENKVLREKAMAEFKKMAKAIREEHSK